MKSLSVVKYIQYISAHKFYHTVHNLIKFLLGPLCDIRLSVEDIATDQRSHNNKKTIIEDIVKSKKYVKNNNL